MQQVLKWASVAVWLVNGLWCKVLGQVPRHEDIVAHILGAAWAPVLTRLIGAAELVMAAWIISGRSPLWCMRAQVLVVMAMNILEQLLVPELLLFGRFNLVWASLFCVAVVFQHHPRVNPAELRRAA